MGMRISSTRDEWNTAKEERGTFSRLRNVMFGKQGSPAMLMLTREHMEGTPDLYKKMLEAGLSQGAQYQRTGEETVKRDGLPGTRWTATLTKNDMALIFRFVTALHHRRFRPLPYYSSRSQGDLRPLCGNLCEHHSSARHFLCYAIDPRLLEGLKVRSGSKRRFSATRIRHINTRIT